MQFRLFYVRCRLLYVKSYVTYFYLLTFKFTINCIVLEKSVQERLNYIEQINLII